MNTEELKREMYRQLETLKRQKKLTGCLGVFEDRLEAYLEALRQEHERAVMFEDAAIEQQEIYVDAYERQKTLTHQACASERESWQTIYGLESDNKKLNEEVEQLSQDHHQASQKLASQTQTIIALHTVIKDLQASLSSSQGLASKTEKALGDLGVQSHREIMKAEAIADERWELLEKRQKTIVKQRKMIEGLTFEIISARKLAQKPRFKWQFWKKTPKVKALPK